jgi:imidazolonepropionase-like amidohydrolase
MEKFEEIKCVTNVSVVDVEKGIVLPNRNVKISNDLIAGISKKTEITYPKDSNHLSGEGLYLMPGLVDSHVHFLDPPSFGPAMIAYGITLIRDMGNPSEDAIMLRNKLQKREVLGPEMLTTGSILDGEKPFLPPISIACKTAEEGREAVRKQAGRGVDQIKVYSGLEKEVFCSIADEASDLGLAVVGHVPESIYIEEAAAKGQRSCEHLFGFGNVIAEVLGEHVALKTGGMGSDVPYFLRIPEVDRAKLEKALVHIRDFALVICPTIIVFKLGARLKSVIQGDFSMKELISPKIRQIWDLIWGHSAENSEMLSKAWPLMQSFVRLLHDVGFKLILGTDLLFPGVVPGYSLHEEMALWQDAGIPASDVLRSATVVPARFLRMDHRLGTIAAGKTASMVLTRDNPLDDIRNASNIEGVFLRGRFYNREQLDALVHQIKNSCK